jgi:hypothetical protein
MEKVRLRTTRDEIERFKESVLWADICEELNSWKIGFEMEMKSIVDDAASTNPSTASVLMHMGDINGRGKAVDYMLNILDVFLSILEDNKDDSRRDKTN